MIHSQGFSLIEMLITLVIISMLMALSLPLYSQYLVQERRLEAASMLSKLAIAMEEYHVEHHSYQDTTLAELQFPTIIVDGHYQLAIQSAEGQYYSLTAIPLGNQAINDEKCASLTLNSYGEKGMTGVGTIDECW